MPSGMCDCTFRTAHSPRTSYKDSVKSELSSLATRPALVASLHAVATRQTKSFANSIFNIREDAVTSSSLVVSEFGFKTFAKHKLKEGNGPQHSERLSPSRIQRFFWAHQAAYKPLPSGWYQRGSLLLVPSPLGSFLTGSIIHDMFFAPVFTSPLSTAL